LPPILPSPAAARAMLDLSLARTEIDDLVAYIECLR
jgi:hypothetical protein